MPIDNLTINAAPLLGVFEFSLGDVNYTIGRYPHPDLTADFRTVLRANGVPVLQRDFIWSDLEEIFLVKDLGRRELEAFNRYLAAHHDDDGAEALSYEEELATFFLQDIELVGNQLVEKT